MTPPAWEERMLREAPSIKLEFYAQPYVGIDGKLVAVNSLGDNATVPHRAWATVPMTPCVDPILIGEGLAEAGVDLPDELPGWEEFMIAIRKFNAVQKPLFWVATSKLAVILREES